MDDLTAVRRAVDRLVWGDIEPLLNLLADNVAFEVVGGGDEPDRATDWGQQAVADYFTGLGGLVAFWQIDWTGGGDQVIAWGRESFTVEGCGLEGGCEFALVFEVDGGRITRFQVVEDLRAKAIFSTSWTANLRPISTLSPSVSSRASSVPGSARTAARSGGPASGSSPAKSTGPVPFPASAMRPRAS